MLQENYGFILIYKEKNNDIIYLRIIDMHLQEFYTF